MAHWDDGDGEHEEVQGVPRIPAPRRAGDGLAPPPRRKDSGVPRPRRNVAPRVPPPPPAPTSRQTSPPANGTTPADRPAEADMPETPESAAATDEREEPAKTAGAEGTGDSPEVADRAVPASPPSHGVLKSLLGAWALSACSAEETAAVDAHLKVCAPCHDEAQRLRGAVELLHTERELDLPPSLRFRVLENCLGRRPARIPVPDWATPYDAETARLDALLRDIGDAEWDAPLHLLWFDGRESVRRMTTVGGVIGHLMTVDGLVANALGLDDPLGRDGPKPPTERTEKFWRSENLPTGRAAHRLWRAQSHTLIRTVSFAAHGAAEMSVSYGDFSLPLRDALVDRAFECWIHADDIADAVDYPYDPPRGAHLKRMIDLVARLLPATLAARRRAGLAGPVKELVAAGAPGRSVRLEVEGAGGGDWYISLDSPAALGSPDRAVAQVALEGVEFCKLVAGHVPPEEAAVGQYGDREAIRDVLFAAASLSRM
ncbi:zf-HC2 domain-containing protein [Streptomyces sp. NPDC048057]|uniref:zf-HC2 domain-containing protein n=1 Tax=Streptomyces sp. NPDC048057 TaxID=3155628 RepID=UPI0033EC18F9